MATELTTSNVLTAWVGGSHAHGLATADSDIDVRVIVMPTREQILLNSASMLEENKSHDVLSMMPINFYEGLIGGNFNLLEAFSINSKYVLLDDFFLSNIKYGSTPESLLTKKALSFALDNARKVLKKLRNNHSLSVVRANKFSGEVLRLLTNIEVALENGYWPTVNYVNLDEVASVRSEGISIGYLEKKYFSVEAAFEASSLPEVISVPVLGNLKDNYIHVMTRVYEQSSGYTQEDLNSRLAAVKKGLSE